MLDQCEWEAWSLLALTAVAYAVTTISCTKYVTYCASFWESLRASTPYRVLPYVLLVGLTCVRKYHVESVLNAHSSLNWSLDP